LSFFLDFRKLKIKGAFGLFNRDALHRVGIDHGRFQVTVAEQLLNGPDIVIGLEQMAGETVAEGMGRRSF
jgi:hypothetical protein